MARDKAVETMTTGSAKGKPEIFPFCAAKLSQVEFCGTALNTVPHTTGLWSKKHLAAHIALISCRPR